MRSPLKILALSDMHWYTSDELSRFQSLNYDLCVLLGDIQVPVIRLMKEYAVDRPLLAVAGNHDEWDTPERGGAESIHGRCVTRCGYHHTPAVQKRWGTPTICVFRCAVVSYPDMTMEHIF